MHILKANFNGTPNVGLYGYATGKQLILGEHIQEPLITKVQEVLGNVDIHYCKIAGTEMPGVFLVGNSKTVLVPGIAFDHEIERLQKAGINCTVIQTRNTCLGNNIVCNDHGAIVSTEFSDGECRQIEKALGVPVLQMDIAGLPAPGSVIVLNGEQGIIHRDATIVEKERAEKHLQVTLSPATANLGTPYLRAAILHNEHGFVIGDQSGGPEIVHIDQALGYLDEDDEE